MKKRPLEIIFTRDFNLWVNQLTTDQYHYEFPKVWGKSLEDQIITYNGRVSSWCRFPDDVTRLKKYMLRKPLSSPFFQLSEHEDFRRNIQELRKIISRSPRIVTDPVVHLHLLTTLFSYKFSYNSLGVFLPGLWKEDFITFHAKEKKKAEQVVQRALETRYIAEGIHKEVGDYMRKWLGPMLYRHGYPASFVKLLTVKETKRFVEKDILPAMKTLQKRSQGFVYMQGKLYCATNLKKFFAERNIELVEEGVGEHVTQVQGTVAYPGKVVTGRVRVVMNSEEVKAFTKGEVLVSCMTAPDYVQAMKKAAAIVTDEGGMLCHAAIVSRELKVPCVIGTKFATKVFKDGDVVEIDAKKGRVRILN